jgi:hypothetical protein
MTMVSWLDWSLMRKSRLMIRNSLERSVKDHEFFIKHGDGRRVGHVLGELVGGRSQIIEIETCNNELLRLTLEPLIQGAESALRLPDTDIDSMTQKIEDLKATLAVVNSDAYAQLKTDGLHFYQKTSVEIATQQIVNAIYEHRKNS